MNVSAVGGQTPPAPPQRVSAPAPRDADGDHDGSTRAAAPAPSGGPVVANGKVDTYA